MQGFRGILLWLVVLEKEKQSICLLDIVELTAVQFCPAMNFKRDKKKKKLCVRNIKDNPARSDRFKHFKSN